MSLETTPVVVGVEGPGSTVGGLETPGNRIKMWNRKDTQVKRVEQEGHTGEKAEQEGHTGAKVAYACLHPSSSTPFLSPIGSPLCQLRMVRGSLQPPSLEEIFD